MSTGELDPRSNAKGALKIEELQEAAAATFARPEFRHICWAGVFGSVAKGTSNENSDVDVIVSAFPEDPSLPPFAPFLQDVLPRIWARPVDVIWIKEGQKELRGFIQLEALLSSRTIYLQDDHARDEVRRLRLLASSILYEGHHLFTRVTSRIHDVTKLADCISFQDFREMPDKEHRNIFLQVHSILTLLDIQPPYHPMHVAFWRVFLGSASKLRKQLGSYESKSKEGRLDDQTLGSLWAALSSSDEDGLEFLARMMRKLVVPSLEETRELSTQTMDAVGFEAEQGQESEETDEK